ncbi:MAG: hypothetical protein AAGG48_20400 [Planctomycetota bacterium]
MSEHDAHAVKAADDPAFQLPATLSSLSLPLCIGGVAALLIGWAFGSSIVSARFGMSAYLTAFMYCLTISLGSLFFVLIQHLVRAGWSVVVRRIAELFMVMVIPLGVLFIPVLATLLFGDGTLYNWDDPNYASENHLPKDAWTEKIRWLSQDWFTARAIFYFLAWSTVAVWYFRRSVEQDETGERAVSDRMIYWSGPAIMVFCGATSFAAFDWVMSLAPMWFSTMFGVYIFAGSVLSAHCMICAVSFLLQRTGAMRDEVTIEHYHDLGKYIFGFVFFWAYISFSQYLLIWYGNIPEETHWFYERQLGVWGAVSIVLILLHWALPFLGTMSLHIRRRPPLITFWAVYILAMHYIDLYWMIMPEAHLEVGGVAGIVCSLLCLVGMLSLMFGLVLRVADQTKMVPVRDPRLQESLAFENI